MFFSLGTYLGLPQDKAGNDISELADLNVLPQPAEKKCVRNFVRIRICNWLDVLYLDSYRDCFGTSQDCSQSGRQSLVNSDWACFDRDIGKRRYRTAFLISDDEAKEIDSETERKQI